MNWKNNLDTRFICRNFMIQGKKGKGKGERLERLER